MTCSRIILPLKSQFLIGILFVPLMKLVGVYKRYEPVSIPYRYSICSARSGTLSDSV